ncbi:CheY chemotaxis protein or a CheY-like REC (receiver) domain [Chitinophaga sp. CF118]|uniref:response regulator n=1 Tax=Chitinophaga sp. CF118 TaxID=1884367 RepID=UPI0008DFFC40|nr:response regulator [Chitinophaga sp. CF118]SFE34773.1 CheY chemotaxis protein or a CheY-like REC (receiver) domain [Chitinophaga sp. CF118]
MRKLNILIAENDAKGKVFIKETFEGSGLFNVLAIAENGDELKSIMEESDIFYPDLILSDVVPGYDVLYYIKTSEAFREIPVVTFASSPADDNIKKCQQLGAVRHFEKPDNEARYHEFAKELYGFISDD